MRHLLTAALAMGLALGPAAPSEAAFPGAGLCAARSRHVVLAMSCGGFHAASHFDVQRQRCTSLITAAFVCCADIGKLLASLVKERVPIAE